MKKFGFIILAIAVSGCFLGCTKKQQSLEEMQEPMSIESLSLGKSEPSTAAQVPAQGVAAPQGAQVLGPQAGITGQTQLESLPPAGPYKPTNEEIQTALKNAGFYAGKIDGKVGPGTKKAIEEFQKANGLKADGKVGPKTWAILSRQLNQAPVVAEPVGASQKKR